MLSLSHHAARGAPMSRRRFLAAAAAGCAAPSPAQPRKPNLIVIFADDLGYGELGCQGNAEIPTPHIDSIARGGIRFTSGYATAPFCCPSRAGLMTGRYQTRFGHELNAVGAQNRLPHVGLPAGEVTLAERLKAAGYATGIVGKWHLGGTPPYHPLRRGFEEFFGFLHEGHFFAPPPYRGLTTRLRPNEPPYDDENPLLRGETPTEEKEYLTHALTREALSFIDRHRERPFFLYLPYNAVHSPMQARTDDIRRFQESISDEQRRVFAGMLAPMDEGVGAVLKRLREHGLEENTLIFFLSDNGGPTAELTSSNLPLRGGKGQLWEGGIRVPFLVQWKGVLPAGRTYDQPVSALDIFPTALAAAGGSVPGNRPIDGVNLAPYLTGQSRGAPHESLFWRYSRNIALRRDAWKLVRQVERGAREAPFRLFDLSEDIGETRDLAGEKPALVRQMEEELNGFEAQMIAPRWGA